MFRAIERKFIKACDKIIPRALDNNACTNIQ